MGQLISISLVIDLEFVTLSKLVVISSSKTLQDQTILFFSLYAYRKLKQTVEVYHIGF